MGFSTLFLLFFGVMWSLAGFTGGLIVWLGVGIGWNMCAARDEMHVEDV